jgi:hypothetical protein
MGMRCDVGILGSARALACWLRCLAATDFAEDAQPHPFESYIHSAWLRKFALARRQRQHARARALPRLGRSAQFTG